MNPIRGVLFDLDGTLVDTAPDLIYALNRLRELHGLPHLTSPTMRAMAGLGSKALLKFALNLEENDSRFNSLREQFLDFYQEHLADSPQFFPHVERVLAHLDHQQIPWGIVTNKLTRHTTELLKILRLDQRPACIVCGDSLSTYKPDPRPILYACERLKQEPKDCLYVGDAITDVTASKAAGTRTLVALYGYIKAEDDPYTWNADGYINEALEIIDWL